MTVFNWHIVLEFSFSELMNFSDSTNILLKTSSARGQESRVERDAIKMRQNRGWETVLVVLLAAHASQGITLVAKGNKMAGATPLPDPHARGCFRRLKTRERTHLAPETTPGSGRRRATAAVKQACASG